ncbi:MAG: formyltetrahydrofolate deformylase [Deltaproteobacteria bacterium]|nr:formyltetrahydrofolate deformylase [Deltaproteobacteria bacterium]
MVPSPRHKRLAKVRVAGPDKKGIIATVTTYLFKNNINIEDIDQRILEGILVMNMVVDITGLGKPVSVFREGLKKVGQEIKMEISCQEIIPKKIKNVALLTTKEPHCLIRLIKEMKARKIRGIPQIIISNRNDLRPVARRFSIPFFYYPSSNRKEQEQKILKKLSEHEIDLIVLARYMQILSPEFCFRHEGKIVNIHPSLLPSFPGARAYSQAFNKGVEVVGVTAHFVTTDLDEGPIICQEAFKIDKNRETAESIAQRGKEMEAKVLARAVKLFCEDRLTLRRGKVIDSRRIHQFEEQVKSFYQ